MPDIRRYKIFMESEFLTVFVVSILLFVVLFPLASQIDFMQNDDWVHYRTVERFLNGSFTLEPIIGSTFYVQGIIGALFSLILGIRNLPFLTLMVSIFNFIIFYFILVKQVKVAKHTGILLSLLLFLNPLHFYSAFGFMIDNYALFFFLVAICGINKFIETSSSFDFFVANLVVLAGFFIRQNFLAVFLGFLILLFLKRMYKFFFVEGVLVILLMFFYYFMFPQTSIMMEQKPVFENSLDPLYIFSFTVVLIVYLGVFLLPVFVSYFLNQFCLRNLKRVLISFAGIVGVTYIINKVFYKVDVFLPSFPYLPNVFTRKGFFPYGLGGNKYHWRGFYDVFESWEVIALFIMIFFLFYLVKNRKRIKLSFSWIFLFVYSGMMLVTPTLYDRYILMLIPAVIIFVVEVKRRIFENRISILAISGFLIFLSFVNYLYSIDYIRWQSYVWNRAGEISSAKSVPRNLISSSHAWNRYYNVDDKNAVYKFTFDSPSVLEDESGYVLFEKYEVKFPGNLFISPKIFLYKIS